MIFLLILEVWRVVGVVEVQRDLHGSDPCVEALGLFLQVPEVVAEPSPDLCALEYSLVDDAVPVLVPFGKHREKVDKELLKGAEIISLQVVLDHVVEQAVSDGGPVGGVEFLRESVFDRGGLCKFLWHIV